MLEPSYHFICGSLGQSWKAKTAQSTLLDIELSSGLKNLAKNNEKLNYLSLVLRYYGVRSRTGGVQFSRSDYFFHELTAGNTIARPPLNSSEFPPLDETQVLSVFLDKISLLAPEDKIKQKEMGQTFIALIDDFRYHRAERDRLTEEAGAALIEGIKSANAGDVALGFIAYRMVVNHAPTMMRVRLSFEGFSNKVFEGCFDKQLLVPSSCSPDAFGLEAGLQIRPATLLLNPARGRIELTLAIDNPAEVGLGFAAKKEASPDYFMLIPEEQIQGTSLVFELYPNRLQNSLDILTGKALFQREGVTLYEAGISMWEE
jgi:hypothetical protein